MHLLKIEFLGYAQLAAENGRRNGSRAYLDLDRLIVIRNQCQPPPLISRRWVIIELYEIHGPSPTDVDNVRMSCHSSQEELLARHWFRTA
jgi:hypothetical protein